MNILLIDADSTIPNLALMKLSTYHKSIGNTVKLVKANLPYYPNRKKIVYNVPCGYSKIYCSVIFENNKEYIRGENIVFGGTGYNLKANLPDDIENIDPDYSLYPDSDTSFGFITRGCIRNCYFCKVPEKEGKIHKVNNIEDIIKHKKVKFFDNNILAYEDHYNVLQELVDKNIRCNFNQGLDIRLLDNENSELLKEMNYWGEYSFAFDHIKYKKTIEEKLKLLYWATDWSLRFFVYVHPKMELKETTERLKFLKEHKIKPYLMRDISCWESKHKDFYTDLASYSNQPGLFKNMSFEQFCLERHKGYKDKTRTKKSVDLWSNQ